MTGLSLSRAFLLLSAVSAAMPLAGCLGAEGGSDVAPADNASALSDSDVIITSSPSGKCIDIASGSTANGATIQQWDCNGTKAQVFHFTSLTGGYTEISNPNAKKALQVKGASVDAGAGVELYDYSSAQNQQFTIEALGNEEYKIVARHSGLALTFDSPNNGTKVVQRAYTGASTQRFKLFPVGPQPLPAPKVIQTAFSDRFRVTQVGERKFQGKTYPVVTSMQWNYLLSHEGKQFPMTETSTHYVVDSHFELPYIPGVMDDISWTPGVKNKGWAIGSNDDPQAFVVKAGGDGRPFLYHVNPDLEYGYFTYTNDPLPGDTIRYTAFRPTWQVRKVNNAFTTYFIDPANPDKYGFTWPRHGNNWDLNFGLFVDQSGKVYVPKKDKAPLAINKGYNGYFGCVVINMGSAPIPTTRTQFPGNESYYASETYLPNYAAPSGVGHRYWGQKGRPMEEVAVWEDNLPGNFYKPYGNGCSMDGYDFGHAEGFTWPQLRDEMYAKGVRIAKDKLYSITLYKIARDGTSEELGTLSYEDRGGKWFPIATGKAINPLDTSRNTFHINGAIYSDRGEYVVAVLRDIP